MGTGTNGTWGRMGNLICPKCLYALVPFFSGPIYPQCSFASMLIYSSAYLLQSLFVPVPMLPSACCLPVLVSPEYPFAFGSFSLYPNSPFASMPISTGVHFLCYPFPCAHFSQMPFWSHSKTFVPMRSHRVL